MKNVDVLRRVGDSLTVREWGPFQKDRFFSIPITSEYSGVKATELAKHVGYFVVIDENGAVRRVSEVVT